VTGQEPDPNSSNNTETETTPVVRSADLGIVKDDAGVTATAGQAFNYTLTVSNSGTSVSSGWTISDTLPVGLSYNGPTGTNALGSGIDVAYNAGTRLLTISTNSDLTVGGSVPLTVSVLVAADVAAGMNLVNQATVTGQDPDPNSSNNTESEATPVVRSADLAIVKTDNSATYTPGGPLTYTITVTNSGPSDATGATVSDLIPAALTGVTWNSSVSGGANVTSGGTGSGNTLSATVNVPAGVGSVIFTVTGTVSASATGDLVNTATVTPPSGTTDPDSGNNSSTDTNTSAVLGAIGNRVWLDEDGDGLQDAGEAGIGGVTVTLRNSGGTVIATTVTGTDGGYLFPDLPPGQYTVTVTPTTGLNQTADPDATVNNSTVVTLALGQEAMTADFGYNWVPKTDASNPGSTATGAIGDRIWNDANGNGVQDLGESGLPGVTVRLLRDTNGDGIYGSASDTGTLTTTTDARGNYIFDGIAPGAYVIDVVTTTLPTGWSSDPTYDPDGDDNTTTQPIVVAPGDVFVDGDFGFQPGGAATSYTIGDQIFVDANANGDLDVGEPVISGVTVNLLNASGQVLATAVTDANGQYEFPNLVAAPGTVFTIQVTDTNNVLGELAPISDQDGTLDNRTTVTIVAGTTDYPTADFGYAPAGHDGTTEGMIGNTVFLDRPQGGVAPNGSPDPGEGIEGVTVELYDAAGTTLLGTTTTDENGNYYFGNLDPAGTYTVVVDPTTLPAGLTNAVDPDGGIASQSVINLASDPDGTNDGSNFTQDFGYAFADPDNDAGDIVGTIWADTDADGDLEGTEPERYENVEVVLLDANGNVVATTTTDSNGVYRFDDLPPGEYTVDVVENGPVLEGLWHSIGTDSLPDPAPVTVTPGGTATADFGYYEEPASIGNRVWNDVNGNGIQDPGEAGIPGVPVTLTITYPNGAVTTLVTQTDGNGEYLFPNLLLDETFDGDPATNPTAGEPTYTVSMATPAGYIPTRIGAAGSTDETDSNDPAGSAATVVRAQAEETIDFGFVLPASLSGTVFDDTNENGGDQEPGEPGTPGVPVYLDLNDNGALDPGEPVTTTNANGDYSFTNLPPGTYVIRELWPDSTVQTTTPNNGALSAVLVQGENATDLDFGNRAVPATVIDDEDPGFTMIGTWPEAKCWAYLNGDARYLCSTDGASSLVWQFTVTPGATYRVSTTWHAASGLAIDAPFTVDDGIGGASPATTLINQTIPPTSYPNSFTDQGVPWADLTAAYTVSGDTLTVTLTNAQTVGCVLGDAVRIMPVTTPEITLLNGTESLVDGSSVVDMGGSSQYTFTVRNDGAGTLNLGTLTWPANFSLVGANPSNTTLAAGQATAFTLQLNATGGGDVILGNNDNNEAPFNFRLQGTVGAAPISQPSAAPAPLLLAGAPEIDVFDGATGLINSISTVDFGTVTTGATATRTLTVQNPAGATSNLVLGAISLPTGFSVFTAYGATTLSPGESTTFVLEMNTAAAAVFTPAAVTLNDGTNSPVFTFNVSGTVEAGTTPPPPAVPIVIDNGTGVAGYTVSGMTYTSRLGYEGDTHYTRGDNSGDNATWTFSNLTPGTYLISTTWVKGTSRASNAPYTLTGVTGGPTTVLIDQKVVPDDLTWNGGVWEHLGEFQISGGTLTVRLTDNANGYVYADAIRLEYLHALVGDAADSESAVVSPEAESSAALSAAVVAELSAAAIQRWSAADAAAAEALRDVQVLVDDLPAGVLGLAAVHSGVIWVDVDADGQGWFVDATPWTDEEFDADLRGQLAGTTWASRGGVDLLTVLAHELGHLLGQEDDYDDGDLSVMEFALPPGVRRLPLPAVGIPADGRSIPENSVFEVLGLPLAEVRRGSAERRDAAGTRADAGLTALLAEQPGAWAPADEELARLTAAPRKRADDPEQRLDDVLSSVGDWLDPLEEVLGFVKQSR
jgi:uncharacterized repeat protein (TIGR01451 family)